MAITANGLTQVENAGDRKALNLKVYSGEVLNAFDKKNMALDLVKVRTISNGKSSQFVVTGSISDTAVATHTPGDDVSTTVMPSNERVILIEDLQYVSSFVDNYEEKMAHFEIRGELAKRSGESLATKIDKQAFGVVLSASQAVGIAGQPDGFEINNDVITGGATAEAKGDALIDTIFAAKAHLEANDVTGDPIFVTDPINYYNIVQSAKAVNRDFNGGDNGSIAKGNVIEIAGIKVVMSNHFGKDTTVVVGAANKYLQGLLFTSDAIGVVKLMDVSSEANYIPEKLGTLMTSTYALGMGILSPASAVAITGGTVV
jgi:hypothetical protein